MHLIKMICAHFLFSLFLFSLYTAKETHHLHPCPHKIIDRGVSKADIDIILKKHNDLRELIANGKVPGQPRGINLKRLKWDKKLADEAQRIADSCNFAHFPVRDDRWLVGQNLHRGKSTRRVDGAKWANAIQSWFDEHKLYTFGPDSISGTGHYSQLVWANTEYVGCGYTFYETDGHMKYHKLYVCNYGPRGNFRGKSPYKVGLRGCENLC